MKDGDFMIGKIVLVIVLVIGALLTYLAETIGQVVHLVKTPEKNILIIKIIGFVFVFISFIITFIKF